MSDTKQLKHAAKAAGFKVARIADDGKALMLRGAQEPWNPRTDNGRAFELAMRAGICTSSIHGHVYASCHVARKVQIENGDIMAAAREAVFMAAVELGKAME